MALAQSPPLPEHPLLTPERVAQLEKGKPVVVKAKELEGEHAGASAAVMGVIDQPAAVVFDTICKFEEQADYMPRLTKVTRYEADGGKVGVRQQLKVMWKTVTYHLLMSADKDKLHLSWSLDPAKDNDIKSCNGQWTFLPWGDRKCIAIYELETDTGMAVPKFIANMLLDSDLPGVMEALKKRTESGGVWKKND